MSVAASFGLQGAIRKRFNRKHFHKSTAKTLRNKVEFQDYDPLTPSRRPSRKSDSTIGPRSLATNSGFKTLAEIHALSGGLEEVNFDFRATDSTVLPTTLKRGHSLTYLGLFVFFSFLSKSALVVAVFTLALFIPGQLGLENRITAKLTEVKLALALLLTGLLSIPLALEPSRAFQSLIEFFKVVVVFIMMVNVVRAEKRLPGMLLLVMFCELSLEPWSVE